MIGPKTKEGGLNVTKTPDIVGERAPDFLARTLMDEEVSLHSLISGRKALLIFYRGGWCPFCNQQLAAISKDHVRFREAGAVIIAVSSEEVQKGKELLQKLALPYSLLSDTGFEGIDRYGVRDPNPSERLKARGVLSYSRPAVFVIDEEGIIRYGYVGKNPQDRPKNEELFRVLSEIG
jgi:peroxiredoxin